MSRRSVTSLYALPALLALGCGGQTTSFDADGAGASDGEAVDGAAGGGRPATGGGAGDGGGASDGGSSTGLGGSPIGTGGSAGTGGVSTGGPTGGAVVLPPGGDDAPASGGYYVADPDDGIHDDFPGGPDDDPITSGDDPDGPAPPIGSALGCADPAATCTETPYWLDGHYEGNITPLVHADVSVTTYSPTGRERCLIGNLDATYDEWGMISWNVSQTWNADTGRWNGAQAVVPEGDGIRYVIQNPGGTRLRLEVFSLNAGMWCTYLSEGAGFVPWAELTRECWFPDGESYDPAIPILQLNVAFSGDEAGPTTVDFCVLELAPGYAP